MYFHATLAAFVLMCLGAQYSFAYYHCDIIDLPKRNEVCVGQIDCEHGVDDISVIIKYWDCIQHERAPNRPYYAMYSSNFDYDEKYDLILNIVDIQDYLSTITVENFNKNLNHVNRIMIRYGNLISIPNVIYSMIQVTEVEISSNLIEEIKLDNFLGLTMLRKINVSHNSISTVLYADEETTERAQESALLVTTIDLSHNLIETIPNNCFTNFIQLQHLNLSHNHISEFDILTFENVFRLQTLHLSNNKIFEIGNTFKRLISLQELSLDNNRVTKLLEYNFVTLSKLVTLNLSSNFIETIENQTFQRLVKLETLDLGYNRIKVFSRLLLEKNNKLTSLSIMHNEIHALEPRSFEGKNISKFYLHGNSLTGTLETNTFKGIFVKDLNLSSGKIATLSDDAFASLQFNLLILNLSSNSISNISKSAFSSLGFLTKLDLSFNNLQCLNFETNDLKNLSILYARNNIISNLNKETFKYLTSLIELDLSSNSLSEIELHAFAEMKNLKLLILKQNILNKVLEANSFQGLVALERIELMNTRTTSYRDQAFSGMTHFQIVNSSFGQLSDIKYNAFKGTGSLEVLDLSHNIIEHFVINTTTIIQIKEIYLNHNLLKNVTNDMFSNLTSMRKINLACNNILQIQSFAFSSLLSLINLDLSLNSRMQISENVFDHLSLLSYVSLENVKIRYNFRNSNASIRSLDLPLCDIEDINTVFIFKIKSLIKLNLSRNKLSFLDKFSFQSMPTLYWLDLSSNMITSIQPGSFLYLNMLNTLNLAANDIPSLQFGVFDGLHNLRELNLSRNAIHSFDAHLLHNTPYVSTLSLDFNDINGLSFNDFMETKITKLSIGGNHIPCEILAKLKKNNYTEFEITAEMLDYNSENFNGVSCGLVFNINNSIIRPVTDETLFEAFEKLRVSIESLGNRQVIANNDDLKADLKKVIKSLETISFKSNKILVEEHNTADIKALLYCITICIAIILIVFSSLFIYTFMKKRGYLHISNSSNCKNTLVNSIELE